ncbi:thiol peroxidase [Candidatus Roizmanbacteria bacterium RIFCSPHIGHO2_02_FULL_40_13b]|nr:MAG: thiol peroxidase [Candidatus Roizmanbacteria bacterium RIFCSPHIGHO2_02_FULL_40_13b]
MVPQQNLIEKLHLLKVGETAPDFSLLDQDGKTHTLSDYRGKWIVLYFYPNDDTPGCTKEACNFRDSHELFKKKNIQVFGVSKNTVKSHEKFAQKYSLSFPILADPEKVVLTKYGVWGEKFFMGRFFKGTYRITYLINPEGKVAKVYTKVDTALHAQEIAQDIEVLMSRN